MKSSSHILRARPSSVVKSQLSFLKAVSKAILIATSVLLAMGSFSFAQTVTLTPTSIAFGNHYLGTESGSQVATLTNGQSTAINISSVSLTGADPGDFVIGNMCSLLHPLDSGLTCTVNVRFEPTTLGTRTASLTIVDTGSDSPQTIALSGVVLSPISIAPASLAFGSQTVDTTSSAATVTITNEETFSVSIPSVTASGPFAVASNTCSPSLGEKLKCTIGVTFTPTAIGAESGTLTINNGTASPYEVALSGTGAGAVSGFANIKHVVIIFQENRTPDNLFQDPVLIANGADIASSGLNSSGETVSLGPIDLGSVGSYPSFYDLEHSHGAFLLQYDGGKMDGANLVPVGCADAGSNPCPPPGAPQYKYVLPSDVEPYFQMAEQYVFGDRMFQTNSGPSFPAHQFILAGTSAPSATSNLMVNGNLDSNGKPSSNGCIAIPGSTVPLFSPTGVLSYLYPCFEHATLSDLLDTAGVSWRYYYSGTVGALWTAPDAIEHMCVPNVAPPNATSCTGADWGTKIVPALGSATIPGILKDITNGNLPSVSWVMPTDAASDHASVNDGTGPSWVSSIVNAIGGSTYWSDTVIIVTWDDWGGWFDHVAPKVVDDGVSWGSGSVYGFRVPLLVISPFAKPAYVSHVTHDFGSILNVVEQAFNLPSLGYADAHADDMSDCFDFTQTPQKFKTIEAPVKADYFLHYDKPIGNPDDDDD
jgi:phospholipase C